MVRLTGQLTRPPGARDLAIFVHGLGGSSESAYMKTAARVATSLGLASLRMNLRGADGEIGDFYHGGLTVDLAAAARDLASLCERIYVVGFSLGGHVALRFATELDEPKVAAVAAICSPLDLAAGADAMDRPMMAPYCTYVLRRLKANYAKNARHGRVPSPPQVVSEARTLRQWDALTVVPRFGFRDVDDYYSRASVGSRLDQLRRPALLVATESDPMVPPSTIRPHLESSQVEHLTVRWLRRGGHLALPKRVDLDLSDDREKGRADHMFQILLWLQRAALTAGNPVAG
jgi:predicted alpha/beta-fold hydrolase